MVQEHPTELFRNAFFLVTSLPLETYSGEHLLALYRRRGKAEAHMGEFKDVIGSSLPCTSCGVASDRPVLARSQALLSLRLLAYQLLHVLRTEMEAVTWQSWSLRRLRERVLKAGARLVTHARRITVVIEHCAADLWHRVLRALETPPTLAHVAGSTAAGWPRPSPDGHHARPHAWRKPVGR